MSIVCSDEELEFLKRFIGVKLKKVIAYKYPNVSGYELLILHFDDGTLCSVALRSHIIQFKFEVFVLQVKLLKEVQTEWIYGVDEFQFHNFEVDSFEIVRQSEWTELDPLNSLQDSPIEKEGTSSMASEPVRSESVLVDVGLAIAGLSGEYLTCKASSFPLVLQFEYHTKK